MMKDIKKNRTVDLQEFEKTMTGVKLEMEEVKANMNKMSEALSKVVDESQKIDQKFEELFIKINEDIRTRDKEQKQESRE